jgi:hypothetical protein
MSWLKDRPKCNPTHFLPKIMLHFYLLKKVAKTLGLLFNLKQLPQRRGKQSPNWQNFAQSGVDVMITIFSVFCQFSAEKAFF